MNYKQSLRWLNAILVLAVVGAGCGRSSDQGSFVRPAGTITLSNFQAAAVVIGQPDFTHGDSNQGGSAAANTIDSPYGSAAVGSLFVPDYSNNRVLGFNSVPTSNDASADFVLGQPDFATTASGDLANQMDGPETAVVDGGKLIVDEYGNSRILIWNSKPSTTQAPADVVVGQPGFGSSAAACTQTGVDSPESVAVAGGKLIVPDSHNNRVLIWNTIPTTNGTPADLVLGQNDFTTCVNNNDGSGSSGSPSAANLDYPSGAFFSNGTQLFVTDDSNHRVMIWDTFPTTNFQAANVVLGQNDFTCDVSDNDGSGTCTSGSPSAQNLDAPDGVVQSGNRLIVTDRDNNRFLVYNGQ